MEPQFQALPFHEDRCPLRVLFGDDGAGKTCAGILESLKQVRMGGCVVIIVHGHRNREKIRQYLFHEGAHRQFRVTSQSENQITLVSLPVHSQIIIMELSITVPNSPELLWIDGESLGSARRHYGLFAARRVLITCQFPVLTGRAAPPGEARYFIARRYNLHRRCAERSERPLSKAALNELAIAADYCEERLEQPRYADLLREYPRQFRALYQTALDPSPLPELAELFPTASQTLAFMQGMRPVKPTEG